MTKDQLIERKKQLWLATDDIYRQLENIRNERRAIESELERIEYEERQDKRDGA